MCMCVVRNYGLKIPAVRLGFTDSSQTCQRLSHYTAIETLIAATEKTRHFETVLSILLGPVARKGLTCAKTWLGRSAHYFRASIWPTLRAREHVMHFDFMLRWIEHEERTYLDGP